MLFSGKIAITSYTCELIQNAKVGDTLENSRYLLQHSDFPEFSKAPPTFAFWLSLRAIAIFMAIFPLNAIF